MLLLMNSSNGCEALIVNAFQKNPKWVPLIASMSSISSANRIQAVPEIDQTKTPPNDNEFEPKFQFLRNRLMPDDLIRVLDTTHDLNSAIKLGMGGKIEDMEAFCSEMVREKCPGGEETLIALISSFVKHRRLSEAIRVLRRDFREILLVYKEIVKAGIVPNVDTLNYLIEALFELNWIDLALDQYRRMSKKGCSPNSKTFDILISGLIARNLVEKSVVVLGEMIELECEADLSFYTSVIPLFCSVHQVEEGMMLFWRMRASKLVPDLLIYRVLIQCLSESLWLDDAINLLEEMIGCGLTPEDDNDCSSFTPDSATYSALVIGNCKLSKCKDGLELFHQMERIQEAAEVFCYMSSNRCALKSSSLDMLMKGICVTGKVDEAIRLLVLACYSGCILDVEAYCILVQSMCALSRTEDIARFFNLMVSEGLVPDSETVATLLSCLTKHSQLHTILTAIGKLASDGWVPDASTHGLLIGSVVSEVPHKEAVEYENSCMQDKIGNILAEGLRET
ncbi:Pentatricopeptide repeat-containing protein [Vitis vinifera]|uniref:Pentatricopeptide repeat-containing protein n=1 Tax=Vitis vinifera TaxID=29760 RepID=A0A438GYY4_VITVI|nr:Pentatricopeptide repeat-containing protein [Vitis vinifera]